MVLARVFGIKRKGDSENLGFLECSSFSGLRDLGECGSFWVKRESKSFKVVHRSLGCWVNLDLGYGKQFVGFVRI